MFLDASGETVFYKRRIDGRDTLFMFRPELHGGDHHAILSVSNDPMNAWPGGGRCVILCDQWPEGRPHLKFKFFDMTRLAYLVDRQALRIHELLLDVPMVTTLTAEHRPMPHEIYDMLKDQVVVVPGKAPFDGSAPRPALFVFDGKDVTVRAVPLSFLAPTDTPSAVVVEPGGKRLWLTMGDSCHLFVLDASTFELVGDIIWPVDEQAMARLAFHPTKPEAWVSTLTGVRVYDRKTFKLLREISCAPELRWHRGDRVKGLIGGLGFNADGSRALVARPLHGDVLEINTSDYSIAKPHPTFVDPLELVVAPKDSTVYLQGMRAGQVSWMPGNKEAAMSDLAIQPQASPDAELLVKDALLAAAIRVERIFSRADEVVVVLPGSGAQRQAAQDVVAGLQRGLNRRIVVMPESGAPPIMRKVLMIAMLAFGALATFALVYPYISSMMRTYQAKEKFTNTAPK